MELGDLAVRSWKIAMQSPQGSHFFPTMSFWGEGTRAKQILSVLPGKEH